MNAFFLSQNFKTLIASEHRLLEARKNLARAELEHVQLTENALAELAVGLERDQSQEEMDDEIRREALKIRDTMFAEHAPDDGPDLVVDIDQAPADAATQPAFELAEPAPAQAPVRHVDPRAARRGLA